MAAGVEKNDEVGRMVAAGGAAGTDGLRVGRGLVQIVHIEDRGGDCCGTALSGQVGGL